MLIPKVIHLVWFGKTKKNKLIEDCIETWRKIMPDWEIKEWNEENYPLDAAPTWVREAYKKSAWAFVSDYVRIAILKKEGGVYLDTDMYMLKNLEPFRSESFFIAKEDAIHLSAGVIGCVPEHPFIVDVHAYYLRLQNIIPIPKVLSEVFSKKEYPNMRALETSSFYPYSQKTIHMFRRDNPPQESFGVHMWNYSWGPWYARILHTLPFYHTSKTILENIGLKKHIKKILRLP